jgi:hypothetical protein
MSVKLGLSFNTLLEMNGLDLKNVKYYRHKDDKQKAKKYDEPIMGNHYAAWQSNHDNFNTYQQGHGGGDPLSRKYVAFFIRTPRNKTVFIGIYEVVDRSDYHYSEGGNYKLCKTDYLSSLIGRLYVNGTGILDKRNAARLAEKCFDLEVIEILEKNEQHSFPGFHDFLWQINNIHAMPEAWKEHLRHSKGVYLLSCPKSHKLYVGSASGYDGFLGRWKHYTESEDGGNKLLIEHNKSCKSGYYVSLLEIAASSDTREMILEKEASWKQKLLTRISSFGLNAN